MGLKSPRTPRESEIPRSPHRSTKRSGRLTHGNNRIQKTSPTKSKPRVNRRQLTTPTQLRRPLTRSSKRNSSTSSDVDITDEAAIETNLVEVNGENVLVVADAWAPEPSGKETPQEPNENAQDLRGLTLASETKEDEKERLQFFRQIHVLFDGDPDQEKTTKLKAFLDTGSQHSLIFESLMKALNIKYVPCSAQYLYSVEQRKFRILGHRQVLFRYRHMKAMHSADVYVLQDPPGMLPNFDVLLGREHLIPAGAVKANYDVIGHTLLVNTRAPCPSSAHDP